MSIHESQSKLWENHVARNPAFAEVLAAELGAGGFAVSPTELHAALVGVEASAVRVSADPLTYPLHIILRFELELALIAGELAVPDLPAAWREGMRRLLASRWSPTRSGPSGRALGRRRLRLLPELCARLPDRGPAVGGHAEELGPRDEDLRHGEAAPIQGWLAERVHRHGRRLDTMPLIEQATGQPLSIEPFLRYVTPLAQGA